MEETKIEGPEASRDGKRNAFHVSCQVVGHNRPYAACLRLIDERKDGRLQVVYADCSAAIGKKQCPALQMRREEVEAHKAIYFIERARMLAGEVTEKVRQFFTKPAAEPEPSKSTPSRKSSVIDRIDTGSYADAINAVASATTPPVKAEPIAGESPLALAKRLLAQQTTR